MKKSKRFFIPAVWISVIGLFLVTGDCHAATSSGWDISNVSGYGLPSAAISDIIENILMWLLGMFGIFGVIGFLISGIMYIVASGNDDMAKRAKNGMTYSIYGIIVGLAGLVVIYAVNDILDGVSYF